MDDLLDMIVSDESPSEISNKIKDLLFAKASERVDGYKPDVAVSMFEPEEESVEDWSFLGKQNI